MKKAKDEYKIGDLVVIRVHNSHYREICQVCGFDIHNEFNLKVKFDDGRFIQGYMTDEVRHLPKLGKVRRIFDLKEVKRMTRELLKYKI